MFFNKSKIHKFLIHNPTHERHHVTKPINLII